MVLAIVVCSLREWILLLARRKLAQLHETAPTWLPDYALLDAKPLNIFGALGLAILLVKELSGQSAIDRAAQTHPQQAYVKTAEKRFNGINRCC
jgi:hypothetical protein